MRRHLSPPLLLAVAIAACGGKLADDESTSTVVPGDFTRDGGTSSTTTDIAHLPGLVLWLESTKGVLVTDDRVTDWLDQSPEHNNLALYRGLGAVAANGIANRQTLTFDGATVYAVPFDTALDDWSGDFLVEAVVHVPTSASSLQAIFSCGGPPPNSPGFTRAVFYVDDDQTSECSIDSDGYSNESKTKSIAGDPALVGYRRSGTTLEARRNGAVDRSDTIKVATSPACGKSIFGANITEDMQSEDDFFSSQVAEVIVVHGALSAQQVNAVEQTLLAKYEIH